MRIETRAEKSNAREVQSPVASFALPFYEMESVKTSYCAASAGVTSSGLLWLLCRLA